MYASFCSFMLIIVALVMGQANVWANENDAWATLQTGRYVVFIRHAITDAGIGDPVGFVVSDCRTQRNLSAQGRADARKIGDEFRVRKIPITEVISSRWCRCVDTAALAFGQAKQSRMLDSMFNDTTKPDQEKIREVKAYAANRVDAGNLVFVTHAQNIQAMTGLSVATGEIIVTKFEGGKFKVIARLNPLAG